MPAARAVQAAERQGKGWEMSKVLYVNYTALADEQIFGYAKGIGLDFPKFKSNFLAKDIADEVDKDMVAARGAGVRGTPTILINGSKYSGARTLEGFQHTVDDEIKRADALISAGTPLQSVYEKLSE